MRIYQVSDWIAHEHAKSISTSHVPVDCTCTIGTTEPACLGLLSNGSSAERWSRPLHITLICYPLSTWLSFAAVCFSSPPDSQWYLPSCLGFTTHSPPAQCWGNGDTNYNVDESKEERMVLCLVFNRIEVWKMPLVQICFIRHLNAPEDPALKNIRQKYSLKAETQLKG